MKLGELFIEPGEIEDRFIISAESICHEDDAFPEIASF